MFTHSRYLSLPACLPFQPSRFSHFIKRKIIKRWERKGKRSAAFSEKPAKCDKGEPELWKQIVVAKMLQSTWDENFFWMNRLPFWLQKGLELNTKVDSAKLNKMAEHHGRRRTGAMIIMKIWKATFRAVFWSVDVVHNSKAIFGKCHWTRSVGTWIILLKT